MCTTFAPVFLLTLITEKPWWFILFCMALGAGYAFLFYPYKTLKTEQGKPAVLQMTMAGLRALLVTLLSFLLLSPLIRSLHREVEKPVVVIAQDNSHSILLNKDSSFYKGAYLASLEQLKEKLSHDYEVRFYTFGKSLQENETVNYAEKQTNISAVMDAVYDTYEGRNLGAVVLATDGIFNEGSNPRYTYKTIKAPVYTVALGDTTFPRDVQIKRVRSNAIAYLGNRFPIEIDVAGYGFSNQHTNLTVIHNGKTVHTQDIGITSNRYAITVPLSFEASEKGMQRYTISIGSLPGELSYLNNTKDVFIDVIDGRQKIMLVANAPHPDLGALKNAIESNQNYEVQLVYAAELQAEQISRLKEFTMVILYQIPSVDISTRALFDAMERVKMPRLYMLGNQSNLSAFNALGEGLTVSGNQGNVNDAQARFNKDFSLFSLSEEAMNSMSLFTPLQAPFGNYSVSGDARILFYQQIGNTSTSMPLILFTARNESKTGIICGEGLWKWRMQEYAQRQNTNAGNEIITKIIQYLAARDDKRLLRVTSAQRIFEENEHVVFDAEAYTPSLELTTDPEVSFKITNEEGTSFDYQFSKSGKVYHLDCGILPVSNYRYMAQAMLGGKNESVSGQFTVRPLQAEFTETVADHQLLATLASLHQGKMFYPADMNALADEILKNERIKPVSYEHQQLQDLINMKWVFVLLLLLLSAEWFLRKREGGY